MKQNRALSSSEILTKKYNLIEWDGAWHDNFEHPEASGIWTVAGHSGSGKTSFLMELIKKLSSFERVIFNSLEEGSSRTMQKAWLRHNIAECGRKVQLVREEMDQLILRLKKRQSPNFIVIDSFQYTRMKFDEYINLRKMFPNKLFIFVVQMDGTKPLGKTAVRVQYDADLKIWVEGFKAFSKGRYLGPNWEKGFIIWEEGAEKYWGSN